MTRFWLVRHGPTHAKAAIGWTDLPADLSDTAALDRLDAHLPRPAKLISSDLIRAAATADRLEKQRNRHDHDADLRELHFGDWEGANFDELMARDPHQTKAFWESPGDVAAPGGESMNDVVGRVGSTLDRLAGSAEDVVIVCHMGAILAALTHGTGMPLSVAMRFRVEPLSVTRMTHLGGDGWRVDGVNHVL